MAGNRRGAPGFPRAREVAGYSGQASTPRDARVDRRARATSDAARVRAAGLAGAAREGWRWQESGAHCSASTVVTPAARVRCDERTALGACTRRAPSTLRARPDRRRRPARPATDRRLARIAASLPSLPGISRRPTGRCPHRLGRRLRRASNRGLLARSHGGEHAAVRQHLPDGPGDPLRARMSPGMPGRERQTDRMTGLEEAIGLRAARPEGITGCR